MAIKSSGLDIKILAFPFFFTFIDAWKTKVLLLSFTFHDYHGLPQSKQSLSDANLILGREQTKKNRCWCTGSMIRGMTYLPIVLVRALWMSLHVPYHVVAPLKDLVSLSIIAGLQHVRQTWKAEHLGFHTWYLRLPEYFYCLSINSISRNKPSFKKGVCVKFRLENNYFLKCLREN